MAVHRGSIRCRDRGGSNGQNLRRQRRDQRAPGSRTAARPARKMDLHMFDQYGDFKRQLPDRDPDETRD
ncbi:MAG: hypothetical protein M3253_02575, partial [Chloroflexota bacterium]|nr:hypothetical protein [Chloroflexota bacterium]